MKAEFAPVIKTASCALQVSIKGHWTSARTLTAARRLLTTFQTLMTSQLKPVRFYMFLQFLFWSNTNVLLENRKFVFNFVRTVWFACAYD